MKTRLNTNGFNVAYGGAGLCLKRAHWTGLLLPHTLFLLLASIVILSLFASRLRTEVCVGFGSRDLYEYNTHSACVYTNVGLETLSYIETD